MEVRFEKHDGVPGFLTVSADDADWVEASFSAINEVLLKFKNKHHWARSQWSALVIQITGVVVGFALSLWAASSISLHLALENSFVITFLFVFVLFANIWGPINATILNVVHSLFPNISFFRPNKDKVNWIMRAIVGGIATAFTLYLFSSIFSYIGKFINEISK